MNREDWADLFRSVLDGGGWQPIPDAEEFIDPRLGSNQFIGSDLYSRRLYCSKFGFYACKPYMTPKYDKYIDDPNRLRGYQASTLCVIDQPPDTFHYAQGTLAMIGVTRVELLRSVTKRWDIMSLEDFYIGL